MTAANVFALGLHLMVSIALAAGLIGLFVRWGKIQSPRLLGALALVPLLRGVWNLATLDYGAWLGLHNIDLGARAPNSFALSLSAHLSEWRWPLDGLLSLRFGLNDPALARGPLLPGDILAHKLGTGWVATLLALAATLTLARLAQLALRTLRTHRLIRTLRITAHPLDPALIAPSTQALLARYRAQVRIVSGSLSPIITGIAQPRIFIGRDLLAALSRDELDAVLLHELGHLKRRDLWVKPALDLTAALLAWTPITGRLIRRWHDEAERACDLFAVRHGASPKALAQALVKAHQHATPHQHALGFRSELGRRVQTILDRSARAVSLRQHAFAALAIAAIMAFQVGGF